MDNPYPSVVRAWNCQNLEFLNCHNFTQMKYTIENLYVDGNTGERAGFWQLGRLSIPQAAAQKKLPGAKGEIAKLASGWIAWTPCARRRTAASISVIPGCTASTAGTLYPKPWPC